MGATLKRSGSTATVALPSSCPRGSNPKVCAACRVPTKAASAPSLIGEELPAVTVPFVVKAGRRAASDSGVLSGRMHSSWVSSPAAMTNPSWAPDRQAASASRCERAAHASCSALPMPSSSAVRSAQAPSESTQGLGNFGLGIRQPTVVWCSAMLRGSGSSDLGRTYGARLMPSTPPAITSEASPVATARPAWMIASDPEAQSRLIVTPGRLTGSPASRAAIRATLRFSSPAPLVLPR